MIAIVGNTLPRAVIVTFIVMPIPPPKQTQPEGTLYILVSVNRAAIEEDKAKLGEDGAVAGEVEVPPNESRRLYGLPETDDVQVGLEKGVDDMSMQFALSKSNGVITCRMTIAAKTASSPAPGTAPN